MTVAFRHLITSGQALPRRHRLFRRGRRGGRRPPGGRSPGRVDEWDALQCEYVLTEFGGHPPPHPQGVEHPGHHDGREGARLAPAHGQGLARATARCPTGATTPWSRRLRWCAASPSTPPSPASTSCGRPASGPSACPTTSPAGCSTPRRPRRRHRRTAPRATAQRPLLQPHQLQPQRDQWWG